MREANINLNFIFNIILKNIIWILIAAVLGGTAMYAYAKYTAVTTYTSSVKFLVRNISKNDVDELEDYSVVGLSASSIEASKSLINTYIEVIKTQDALEMFLEDIKENDGYKDMLSYPMSEEEINAADPLWVEKMSIGEIGGSLYMYALGETEILKIDVTSFDVRKAEAISIAIENVVPSVINELYDIGSVKVIESALTPYKVTSSYTVRVGLGAVLGFVLSAAIFFIFAYLDNTIKSEEDIKEGLGILSLGEVPDLVEVYKHKAKYGSGYGKYGRYGKYGGYGYDDYGGYASAKSKKNKVKGEE